MWRDRVEMLRPKLPFVVLGYGLYALILPILALAIAANAYPAATPIVHCLLFGTMALRYGYSSTRNARSVQGTLAIDDAGVLTMNDRIIARKDELAQGFVMPTADGILVRLERVKSRRPLFLRVRDEAQGISILRALGFDADSKAAQMKIASSFLAMSVWMQLLLMMTPVLLFVGVVVAFGAIAPTFLTYFLPFSMVLFMAYMMGITFSPTTVSVGTDGIHSKWLQHERFHPFASLRAAEVYSESRGGKRQHGVELHFLDGTKAKLPTGQTDIGEAEARRVHHRILEASQAHAEGANAPAVKDVLLRGSRTFVDWVRELRRLGGGAHDHRSAAVPIDVLLRVLEDSKASAQDRASAAVAVAASSDDDVRARIRVAAETSASPMLRIALTRIADTPVEESEEEAIAATLSQLEAR